MTNSTNTVRYTATLPTAYIDELKKLTETKEIPSINFAIKQALKNYLEQEKLQKFNKLMQEASQDEAFIERTMECERSFEFSDSEVSTEW